MQQQTSHNRQKKLAVINDFCGFGRCSIAVALPIISAMHIQCCPLPTAIFSDHTGFESFFCEDFTEHMPAYSREWEKLGLTFDGAATGFLGSARQIDIVKEFLTRFKTKRTKVLVDPVMGDYGKLYPTYTQELAGRMHELLRFADLLTPNLTEACILAKEPYREDFSERELTALCARLAEDGPQEIVISGIHLGDDLGNFVFSGAKTTMVCAHRVGGYRSGTRRCVRCDSGSRSGKRRAAGAVGPQGGSIHHKDHFLYAAARRSGDGRHLLRRISMGTGTRYKGSGNMKNRTTRRICLTALMAAIIYVFTAYIHVPSHTGYTHVGDGFLYLAASLLPAPFAAAAGAIGAGLADLLSGYGIWAPGTVIIKVLTAFCFTNRREKLVNKRNVLGILPALVLCVGGYYLYEALITGNFTAPALGIPGYLTQVALSSVVYLALGSALDRAGIKKKLGEI